MEEAKKLEQNQEFEKALEILENLLAEHPGTEEVKQQLMSFLFTYGGYLNDEYVLEFEKAASMFERLIELDPDNYRAHYNLGIAYSNLERDEDAIRACEEAVRIKPDYKHCIYTVGFIHEGRNELLKALHYYKEALKIDPKFPYAVHAKKAIEEQMSEQNVKLYGGLQLSKEKVSKLISLLKMSKKIKIEMIQGLLEVDQSEILELLVEWGSSYDFEIDGEYVIVNKDRLDALIEDLNS